MGQEQQGIAGLALSRVQQMVRAQSLRFEYKTGRTAAGFFELVCQEFEARAGEITGIVGSNGSGKTTLVKLLLGELQPRTGSIWLDGAEINCFSKDERHRLIGWVHMDSARLLVDEFTVEDHFLLSIAAGIHGSIALPFFPKLAWVRSESFSNIIAQDLVAYDQIAGRYVAELSSGQKQALGNALGFSSRQKLLIADEGTATLDAVRSTQFCRWLESVVSTNSCAAVLVSHDLRLVAEYCRDLYVVDGGQVYEMSDFRDRSVEAKLRAIERRMGM